MIYVMLLFVALKQERSVLDNIAFETLGKFSQRILDRISMTVLENIFDEEEIEATHQAIDRAFNQTHDALTALTRISNEVAKLLNYSTHSTLQQDLTAFGCCCFDLGRKVKL